MTPFRSLLPLIAVGLVAVDAAHAQFLSPISRDWVEDSPRGPQFITRSGWGDGLGGMIGATSVPPGLLWSFPSDGTWIADALSINASGTQVVAEYGSSVNRLLLLSGHDADPASPVWEDVTVVSNLHRQVRAASDAPVFVSVHQVDMGSAPGVRHAVLRKYSLEESTPDWVFVSPVDIPNHSHSAVDLSSDGSRIVLVVHDFSASAARFTVFEPDSAVPLIDTEVGTSGPFVRFELSRDGSTAMLGSLLRTTFVDVTTGTVLNQVSLMGSPQYGALAISGDGSMAAFGTMNFVRLYSRGTTGTFDQAHTHDLAPGTYARRLAFSRDGSTLVMGTHAAGDTLTARLSVLDVPSLQLVLETEITGAGSLQNMISDLSVSATGHRFAVALWGDEDGLAPEVLAFRRDSSVPLLAQHLPGSAMRIELSADGNHVAVASKGVHANIPGGGGSFWLSELGRIDLDVIGVPRIGSTVWVRQRLRPDTNARVLQASALANVPAPAPAYGHGLLYLDPASLVELPATVSTLTDGGALTPYTIPNDPSLVGQTVYLQGLDLDESRLSRSWIPLTILP